MNQAFPRPFSESDLWPEESKLWFTWSDNQRLLADQLADDIERLYTSCLYREHWQQEIRRFYETKAVYDTKKAFGEYVNPAKDPWPFELNSPREYRLPDDLSALYTILARFHDWMPGRRSITSSTDGPTHYEFMTSDWVNMTSYGPKRKASTWSGLEQRQVKLSELQTFFDHVEKVLLKQFPGRSIDKVPETIVQEVAKAETKATKPEPIKDRPGKIQSAVHEVKDTPKTNAQLIYQSDAAEFYNIPKGTLSKAAKKQPAEFGYLWSGQAGKRVFYQKADCLKLSRSRAAKLR